MCGSTSWGPMIDNDERIVLTATVALAHPNEKFGVPAIETKRSQAPSMAARAGRIVFLGPDKELEQILRATQANDHVALIQRN